MRYVKIATRRFVSSMYAYFGRLFIKMTVKKKNPKKAGRKWFDGKNLQNVLAKLEEATAIDASVEECLYYADIKKDSYYDYLKANPKFAERLAKLREKPVMLARQTAVKRLTESYSNAMDYLKRKRKLEFGDSSEVTIKVPKPIIDVHRNDSNQESEVSDKED